MQKSDRETINYLEMFGPFEAQKSRERNKTDRQTKNIQTERQKHQGNYRQNHKHNHKHRSRNKGKRKSYL